jgi:hypothetical protein
VVEPPRGPARGGRRTPPGVRAPRPRVVMVVALGLPPDDLAVHHRQPRPPGRLVARTHLVAGASSTVRYSQPPDRRARRKRSRTGDQSSGGTNSMASTHSTPSNSSWEVLQVVLVGGDLGEPRCGGGQVGPGMVHPSSRRPLGSTIGKYDRRHAIAHITSSSQDHSVDAADLPLWDGDGATD